MSPPLSGGGGSDAAGYTDSSATGAPNRISEEGYAMNASILSLAKQLPFEEQLELVEALWDNIVDHGAPPELTPAQKAELDRRIADYEANPDDLVPWSEVKAAVVARIGR